MKTDKGLLKMTPGLFLTVVSLAYFIACMVNIFVVQFTTIEVLQVAYMLMLLVPLVILPVGVGIGLTKWWRSL
jgi:hypothetical protein